MLNEYGNGAIGASEYYSKSEKVKNIEAIVYDAFGKEIKKIKRKDFRDQSIADGFSVLTDGRILFLDYTPTQYPYTVEFTSEVESINTAFLPSWSPIDRYLQSVEMKSFKVIYPSDLGFKHKFSNFELLPIEVANSEGVIQLKITDIKAEKREENTPNFTKIYPVAKFGLEKINLEGVEGLATSWEELGRIWYKELVEDKTPVSDETINKIKELTNGINDPIEKAKIIYKYVQSKTRYVSIQLGIGGWKPMLAKDVDKLGYGDCKALTNYTRILLENVGVPSYYTVIYGDSDKRDFDKDFVSNQGNHVILTIPHNNELKFLECTSQTSPFAYGGDFTDDRYALLIKPEGGEIVKTNEWDENSTKQQIIGNYKIDENGHLDASFSISSGGLYYEKSMLKDLSKEDVVKYYKSEFDNLSNMKIGSFEFKNDANAIQFTENLQIHTDNYVSKANESLIFVVNVFNRNTNVPKRVKNRKHPFEISRGFQQNDTFEIELPKAYKIEFMPENTVIENEFGFYKVEYVKKTETTILYKRTLKIKKSLLNNTQFESYRNFREQIARNDNAKVILTK